MSSANEGIRLEELNINLKNYINQIGNLANLPTENKNDLVSSITELQNIIDLKGTQVAIDNLSQTLNTVQQILSNLQSLVTFKGSVEHYSDIDTNFPTPEDKDWIIVYSDENKENTTSRYFYVDGEWNYAGILSETIRDFTVNPINLATETTSILPKEKMDLTGIATEDEVNRKVDKINNPVENHIVVVDSNGNLIDSGKTLDGYYERNSLVKLAETGLYSDLYSRPTLPSKTSDLVNDLEFLEQNSMIIKSLLMSIVTIMNTME